MSIPLLVFVQFLEPGLGRCTCRNEQNPLALIKLKVLLLGHKVDLDLSTCLLNISVLHCGISHYDRIAGIQFVYVRSMKLFGRGRRDICKVCYQNPYPSRLKCARNFSTESFRVGGQTTSAICGSLVRRTVNTRLSMNGFGRSHSPATSRLSRLSSRPPSLFRLFLLHLHRLQRSFKLRQCAMPSTNIHFNHHSCDLGCT